MITTKKRIQRRPKTFRKNFRLSDLANDLLARGAQALGITETAFVELAVREKFAALPNEQQRT
jgi:hypothetical protein